MDNVYTWGPPIWKTSLDDHIIQRLLNDGEKIRNSEDYNAEKWLAMNTHDEWYYPRKVVDWFSSEIKIKVIEYMKIWADHLDIKVNPERFKLECNSNEMKYQIDSLWVNYMQKHDCNPLHDHSGNVSFIVYLNDVPDLKTEKQRMNMTNNGPTPGSVMFCHNDHRKFFFPNKGEIFLFPSNTLHMVIPYKSDLTRISVSGNILFPTNPYH